MKLKLRFFPNLALPSVLVAASINHLLTFLAYSWYAGIDSYSYDVCGLQLVSGYVFDIFPILYRPPLIPILKNILYLIFEGHPYGLSILLHSLGVVTAALAYRLGCRFHKAVGFALGMLMALNLPMSIHFHYFSSVTFLVPLLLLTADCFVTWVRKPNVRSLTFLVIMSSLCFLTRMETIVLIPVFCIFGWLIHRRWKQTIIFLLMCAIIYNLACFFYYTHFGYWGITYNSGYSLFIRLTRAKDYQFNINNGPASREVYEYLHKWVPVKISVSGLAKARLLTFVGSNEQQGINLADIGIEDDITIRERQMFTFNFAQREIGFLAADRLFLKACIEAVRSDPWKFIKFTFLRILGQLDLYHIPGLKHKESLSESESGHMQGFEGRGAEQMKEKFYYWSPVISKLDSPLQWERRAIKARLCRIFGLSSEAPELPDSFQMHPHFAMSQSGLMHRIHCGDGIMEERFWTCSDLDVYFFLAYWGYRDYSRGALKVLKIWDMFLMPRGWMRININRIMWCLWIISIFALRGDWRSKSLAAFLSIVIFYAFCQSIFSDNFGGRFELHMIAFLWLGGLCGILALYERWRGGAKHLRKISSQIYPKGISKALN